MKIFIAVVVEIILVMLALVNLIRIGSRSPSEWIVGGLLSALCIVGIVKVHRWAKKK
jgi:hypothetical protein